jgi:Ni/Co efflux regulator RcnB
MKQLISVLVAALFAAVSMTAVAQDKKGEKAEAKSGSTMEQKDAKGKKATTKRTAKKGSKKSSDAAKKSSAPSTTATKDEKKK